MQTLELISSLPDAERSLGAHRWGMKPSPPRVLAARLLQPKTALRLCRRGSDGGAPQLVRLMVEHGGHPVPRTAALEPEAARLWGWFPLIESDAGWAMPRDLAAAAASFQTRERFFAATLTSHLSDSDRTTLARELGVPPLATRAAQQRAILGAIAEGEPAAELREAAANVERLQAVKAGDIAALALTPDTRGQLCLLRLDTGEELAVCPRELAERLGARFAPVLVDTVAAVGPEDELPAVHVPTFQEVGSLVRFATARAADEAQKFPEFRSVVARRIDDRTVATRPACAADEAARLLLSLGFHVEPDGRSQ